MIDPMIHHRLIPRAPVAAVVAVASVVAAVIATVIPSPALARDAAAAAGSGRALVVVRGNVAIAPTAGFLLAAPEGWRPEPLPAVARAAGAAAAFQSGDAVALVGVTDRIHGTDRLRAIGRHGLLDAADAVEGCNEAPMRAERRTLASGEWDLRVQRCTGTGDVVGMAALGAAPGGRPALLVIVSSSSESLDLAAWERTLGEVRWAVSENDTAQQAHERAEKLAEAGDAPGALAAWEEALEAAPDFWPAAAGRGRALLKLGRLDEARAALEGALRLEPRDQLTRTDLLRLGIVLEDADLVARLAIDVLASEPGATDLQRGAARVLSEAGRGEALARLAPVLLLASLTAPADPFVPLALMTAFEHGGDSERALLAACRAEKIASAAMERGDRAAAGPRVAALRGISRLAVAAGIDVPPSQAGRACALISQRVADAQPAPTERPVVRPETAPAGATIRRVALGGGHELLLPLPSKWRVETRDEEGHDLAGIEVRATKDVSVWLTAHPKNESETLDEVRRRVELESGFFKGAFGGETTLHDVAGPEASGRLFRHRMGGVGAGGKTHVGGELVVGPLLFSVTVVVSADDAPILDDVVAALAHARHESSDAGS